MLCLGGFFALSPVNSAHAAIPPANTPVLAQSIATYSIGPTQFSASSNPVTTMVLPTYSVALTPFGTIPAPAYALQGVEGDTLYATFTLENQGNARDSLFVGHAQVPPSTVGVSDVIFFYDANASGTLDPGEEDPSFLAINMAQTVPLSAAIVLATGQGSGVTYLELSATSVNDASAFASTVVRVTTQALLVGEIHLGPFQNAEALNGGEGSPDDVTDVRVGYTDTDVVFRNDVTNLGTLVELIEIGVADTTGWPSGISISFEDTLGQALPNSPISATSALVGVINSGATQTVLTRVSTSGAPFYSIALDSLSLVIEARSLVDTLRSNATTDRILLPTSFNPGAVISLQQTFTENVASFGDVVTLVVKVSNISDSVVVDSVAVYEDAQAALNFQSSPTFVANGQSLRWMAGSLQPGESRETVIKFIANSRVLQGETKVTGNVQGVAVTGDPVFAGPAVNTIQIINDIFSQNGFVFGDVFDDRNANQRRDDGESGFSDVAVYLDSGEFAVTDSLGKFSIPRTFPGWRVVRVDESTLPPDVERVHDRTRDNRPLTEKVVLMVPSGHASASFPLRRMPHVATQTTTRDLLCHELVNVRRQAHVLYQIPAVPSSHFPPGRAFLKTEYLQMLDPIVGYLATHPGWDVMIEGHTDSIPIHNDEFASNEQLSLARASAVMRYLTANGIPRSDIIVRGYGDSRPVASNVTVDGRRKNRRVDIAFVPNELRGSEELTVPRVQAKIEEIQAQPDSFDVHIVWEISTNSADTFAVNLSAHLPPALLDGNVSVKNGDGEIPVQNGSVHLTDFAKSRGITYEITGRVSEADTAALRLIASAATFSPNGAATDAPVGSPNHALTLRPNLGGLSTTQSRMYALASWEETIERTTAVVPAAADSTGAEGVRETPRTAAQDSVARIGIFEPADGTIFSRQAQIMVSIRVPLASESELVVNGRTVPESKIGQKVIRVGDKIEELTYFGVNIDRGWNTLVVHAKPIRGPAIEDSIMVALAGQPREIKAEKSRVLVSANGIESPTVRFSVLDQYGLSVIDGLVATVVDGDTLLAGSDARPDIAGWQVVTRDGYFQLPLKPRQRTGRGRVVIAMGELDASCEIAYVPPNRPVFLAGLAQATLGSFETSGDADPLGLENYNDGVNLDGDARLIAQGTGAGGVNVTARLDTKKRYEDPLLKTINPDESYAIYGDASEMYYAAPAQGGNYLAVEKDESFLRYGDFRSPFTQGEFLTYRRSTTGLSGALFSGGDGVRGFVAETDYATFKDEVPGDGTSGFYYLQHSPVVENSISIVLQTRNRFQPEQIVDIQPLVQFRDYTVNYFDGTILFKEPVPVTTPQLDPIIIVAIYEVRTDKEAQYLYGFRGDVARFGRFNLGAQAVGRGRDNLDYALYGFDGRANYRGFGVSGEFAQSEDDVTGDGNAYKVEGTYSHAVGEARVFYRNLDETFTNPSFAGARADRFTKSTGYDALVRLAPVLRIESNGYYQELARTDQTESSIAAMGVLDRRSFSMSAGARSARENTMDTSAHGLLSLVGLGVRRANGTKFHLHWEHNLGDEVVQQYPDRVTSILAIPFHERFSVVTNYEYRSAHGMPATHQFLSGVEARLSPSSVAYTKYAMNQTASNNRMGAISGLKQNFRLGDMYTALLNIEGQLTFSGSSDDQYLVVKTGMNRIHKGFSLIEGSYEYRWQTISDRHLLNLIAVRQLHGGMAILFKNALSVTFPDGKSTATHSEGRLSFAYRPDVSPIKTLFTVRSLYDRFSPIDPLAINWRLVFSTDINIIPSTPHEFRIKLAAKRVEDYSFNISETTDNYLVLSQYVLHFAENWDFNLWGRFLGQGGAGTRQLGAGTEIGRLFFNQVRISAGYAINGFEERDLAENDAWEKGFGIRVQYILSDWILNELGLQR